ncbi:hypothetical protein ACSQD5_004795, partial [Escherichia coli]
MLKETGMVNPPERRGISAQVFLLYPFCAGSGADTELTGRHPAPCFAAKVLFLFFSNYHRYPFISGCAWRGLFFTTSHWQMAIL